MPLSNKWFTITILVAFLAAACGASPEPTQDVDAILTQGVGTMVASFFGTQTAMYTPPSPTSTVTQTPFPTPTTFSSPTSPPTSTPVYFFYASSTPTFVLVDGTRVTPTINPSSLGAGCNNLAFIRDVTIPAGTVLKPNEDFVKTWKVQNTGSCPWMYQYFLVSTGGPNLDPGVTKIQKRVDPSSWAELSVNVTAPKAPGAYTSSWRLADSNGALFGATLVLSFEVVE